MKYDEVNKTAERVALSFDKTELKVQRYLKLWERKGRPTDKALALEYLWKNRKEGLTQADAVRHNDLRLSATIKSLRDDDGFAIITREIPKKVKRGNYGCYHLIVKGETADDFGKVV